MLLYQGNYSVENSNLYTFEIKIFGKLLDVLCDRGCYSAGKKYNLQLATWGAHLEEKDGEKKGGLS